MSEIISIRDDHDEGGHYRQINANKAEFRINDINYSALITETEDAKILKVLLNGKSYTVQIRNHLDDLIAQMGLNVFEAKDAGDIFSPMPGLVVDVMIKEGDLVEEGQSLLILEAMKMENIIKSKGKGLVEKVAIKIDTTVDKGQLLISLKSVE